METVSADVDVCRSPLPKRCRHCSQDDVFVSKFKTDFKPVKFLGRGTYGCVFEVEWSVDGFVSHDAIKRIAVDKRNAESAENALKEVRIMRKLLKHHGIVTFHHAWKEAPPPEWQRRYDQKLFTELKCTEKFNYREDSWFLYIHMELCQSSLADWLKANQKRDWKRMKNWFRQIVSAVDFMHGKGITHRDLKPSNILFSKGDPNHLLICDLATLVGSPLYMAPEDFCSEGSCKVDIYALGLILTELLISMTDAESERIFADFGCGIYNNVLQNSPEAERMVSWLTNKDPTKRPDCKEILEHIFLDEDVFESEVVNGSYVSSFQTKFTVRSIIGHGSYGFVFKVHNLSDNAEYAVKRIPVRTSNVQKDFEEVRSFTSLKHEGIVKTYSTWVETPPNGWQRWIDKKFLMPKVGEILRNTYYPKDCIFIYIQMELCKNSLYDWLEANDTRDLLQARLWFKQIVSAVEYIHINNKIHRDLKPSNIRIDDWGHLKICDLGIITERVIRDKEEMDATRTNIGTPMYMAPEQSLCSYDSKVDIFAMGLILIELCVVMTNDERASVFANVRRGLPIHNLQHTPEVAAFIAWLTQPDPDKRPTCEEILTHHFLS